MCKEAHDRFEYPWPVSRSVSVGGRGNNRKSDTDYRRYRDFSLVIATPSDTITWTTGDYEYQVSLHIRCLRYDTARSCEQQCETDFRNGNLTLLSFE